MRLFRIVLYMSIIVGLVIGWEFIRDDARMFIENISDIVTKEEAPAKQEAKPLPVENKPDLSKKSESDGDDEEDEADDDAEDDENEDDSKDDERNALPSQKAPVCMQGFEKGFSEVAKKAMHSVVNVATMQLSSGDEQADLGLEMFGGTPFDDILKDFFGKQKKQKAKKTHALGSGFIVKITKDKAYVVTNYHVIEKAKKVIIFLSDKTELPAEIHASDQRTDIAVLAVDIKPLGDKIKDLQAIKWGDSEKIEEGNWVVAIGNPFGFGSTVTAGIISGKSRNIGGLSKGPGGFIDDFIQHSAQINVGNSGGCLLDIYGNVIGINNAIFSTSGGNIGIGFAIPSNIAQATVDQLIEHKRTFRGWLGVEVHLVTSKQAESVGIIGKNLDQSKVYGVFVARVVPGGPAEKSGIKKGDIILEFDGKKVTEKNSLQRIVGSTKINRKCKAKIWRQADGEKWKEIMIDVMVGDFERAVESGAADQKDPENKNGQSSEESIDPLGISISVITPDLREGMPDDVKVIVTKTDDGKESSFYGPLFAPGDGILMANNKKVTGVAQFKKIIEDIKKDKALQGKPIPFVIIRDGAMVMLATTIDFPKDKPKPNKKKK